MDGYYLGGPPFCSEALSAIINTERAAGVMPSMRDA